MTEQTRSLNPQGPTATDHYHDQDGSEQEVVSDLMARLGVSCGNLGAHSHPSPDRHTGGLHHHHDLRCLVEAGRIQGRQQQADRLAEVLTSNGDEISRLMRQIDRLQQRVEKLTVDRYRLSEEQRLLGGYLAAMPAVGPWETLAQQYDSWREEMEDEATVLLAQALGRELTQTETTRSRP